MFSARADALFFGCKLDHKLVTRATGKRSSPTPAAWPGPTLLQTHVHKVFAAAFVHAWAV